MQIEQLLLGRVNLPAEHPRAGEDYPLYGYLIEHPAGPILVDTGAGPGHDLIDALFAPVDIDLPEALKRVGVGVEDIIMVISTHLHFDHIGGNRRFPGVPIVAQRADYVAAQEPGFTVQEWAEFPGVAWHLVEGDERLLPGIDVMHTPSHTPGHQAVLVRSAGRLEIIAGQALHNCEELDTAKTAESAPHAGTESFESVASRLKELAPDVVWFSHDDRPWPMSS